MGGSQSWRPSPSAVVASIGAGGWRMPWRISDWLWDFFGYETSRRKREWGELKRPLHTRLNLSNPSPKVDNGVSQLARNYIMLNGDLYWLSVECFPLRCLNLGCWCLLEACHFNTSCGQDKVLWEVIQLIYLNKMLIWFCWGTEFSDYILFWRNTMTECWMYQAQLQNQNQK